jgi:hypothetical protein
MTGRTISIVGGGWSMLDVNQARIPGEIIAVNDSAFYLKRKPNYIVSMDRLWTEHRWSMGTGCERGLGRPRNSELHQAVGFEELPLASEPMGMAAPFRLPYRRADDVPRPRDPERPQ